MVHDRLCLNPQIQKSQSKVTLKHGGFVHTLLI